MMTKKNVVILTRLWIHGSAASKMYGVVRLDLSKALAGYALYMANTRECDHQPWLCVRHINYNLPTLNLPHASVTVIPPAMIRRKRCCHLLPHMLIFVLSSHQTARRDTALQRTKKRLLFARYSHKSKRSRPVCSTHTQHARASPPLLLPPQTPPLLLLCAALFLLMSLSSINPQRKMMLVSSPRLPCQLIHFICRGRRHG